MNNREIQTLMNRLFYGDIDQSDGWCHLMKDESLDKALFEEFVAKYVEADTVLVYLNSQNSVQCEIAEAYQVTKEYLKLGRVKMADPKFKARLIIDPIGVGVGQKL